jgi:hypothetical protein
MKHAWITLGTVLLLAAACHSDNPEPAPAADLPKLRTVTTYFRNGQGEFSPSMMATYFYGVDGRFERSEGLIFNTSTSEFKPYSKTALTYNESGRVSRLEAAVTGTSVKEIVQYQYDNTGRVTHMSVDESGAIPDVEISVTYEPGDTLKAFYQYSNGDSFTYKAFVNNGNIAYEKTITNDNRLSSESANHFDDHVNPYNALGYLDPLFSSYSKNNKMSVATEVYIGTPEGKPEFYDYTYNEAGLPLTQLITLKSNIPGPHEPTLKYVFEYDQ